MDDEHKDIEEKLEELSVLKGAIRSLLLNDDFEGYSVGELSQILGCSPSELDRLVDRLNENKPSL